MGSDCLLYVLPMVLFLPTPAPHTTFTASYGIRQHMHTASWLSLQGCVLITVTLPQGMRHNYALIMIVQLSTPCPWVPHHWSVSACGFLAQRSDPTTPGSSSDPSSLAGPARLVWRPALHVSPRAADSSLRGRLQVGRVRVIAKLGRPAARGRTHPISRPHRAIGAHRCLSAAEREFTTPLRNTLPMPAPRVMVRGPRNLWEGKFKEPIELRATPHAPSTQGFGWRCGGYGK